MCRTRFAASLLCAASLVAISPLAHSATFTTLKSLGKKSGDYGISVIANGKGTVYGTTGSTLFKYSPASAKLTVLHTFGDPLDPNGSLPDGPLSLDSSGNLIGSTELGGGGGGVVFRINPNTGAETLLHTSADSTIRSAVLDKSGIIYGATDEVVFKLDPVTLAYTVLYRFKGDPDGSGGLGAQFIDNTGILYGETLIGGAYNYGTIFKLDPNTGVETILHSFAGGSDGEYPVEGLVVGQDGMAYGATSEGPGVLFRIDPASGGYSIAYHFTGGADGDYANIPLTLDQQGVIYGSAAGGGSNVCGTIFDFDVATSLLTTLATIPPSPRTNKCGFPMRGNLGFAPDGILYGETYTGGKTNKGSLFDLTQ